MVREKDSLQGLLGTNNRVHAISFHRWALQPFSDGHGTNFKPERGTGIVMVKRMIFGFGCALPLFFGCGLTDTAETKVVRDTIYVRVHDTIFSTPRSPGAPLITSLVGAQRMGQDNKYHNYIDIGWSAVKGAIGYNVYYSMAKTGPYSLMSEGTFYETSKSGMYTYSSGTLFFQVAAVNNDGVEGPKSPAMAIIYDGVK